MAGTGSFPGMRISLTLLDKLPSVVAQLTQQTCHVDLVRCDDNPTGLPDQVQKEPPKDPGPSKDNPKPCSSKDLAAINNQLTGDSVQNQKDTGQTVQKEPTDLQKDNPPSSTVITTPKAGTSLEVSSSTKRQMKTKRGQRNPRNIQCPRPCCTFSYAHPWSLKRHIEKFHGKSLGSQTMAKRASQTGGVTKTGNADDLLKTQNLALAQENCSVRGTSEGQRLEMETPQNIQLNEGTAPVSGQPGQNLRRKRILRPGPQPLELQTMTKSVPGTGEVAKTGNADDLPRNQLNEVTAAVSGQPGQNFRRKRILRPSGPPQVSTRRSLRFRQLQLHDKPKGPLRQRGYKVKAKNRGSKKQISKTKKVAKIPKKRALRPRTRNGKKTGFSTRLCFPVIVRPWNWKCPRCSCQFVRKDDFHRHMYSSHVFPVVVSVMRNKVSA